MKYQKIMNLLDNTLNQPSTFKRKTWVEINDESRGTYNTNSQIKFKTSMLKSGLCDYSDTDILVSGTITVQNTGTAAETNNRKNRIICAPYTDCISEINNTQIDNAKDMDIVMSIYDLKECSSNHSKTTRSLWQYYRDEAFLGANNAILYFPADNNNSGLFTFKTKITGRTENHGTKTFKIIVPLKYFINFWRNLEMPLVNPKLILF